MGGEDEGFGASVLQGETESWVGLVSSREGLSMGGGHIDVCEYLTEK